MGWLTRLDRKKKLTDQKEAPNWKISPELRLSNPTIPPPPSIFGSERRQQQQHVLKAAERSRRRCRRRKTDQRRTARISIGRDFDAWERKEDWERPGKAALEVSLFKCELFIGSRTLNFSCSTIA